MDKEEMGYAVSFLTDIDRPTLAMAISSEVLLLYIQLFTFLR